MLQRLPEALLQHSHGRPGLVLHPPQNKRARGARGAHGRLHLAVLVQDLLPLPALGAGPHARRDLEDVPMAVHQRENRLDLLHLLLALQEGPEDARGGVLQAAQGGP